MPVSAGIMAAGSIGSSVIGAFGASNAASQQVAAQQQAMAQLQQILGPVIQTGQGLVSQGQGIVGNAASGLTGAGNNIISSVLPSLTKLLTPGPNQNATLSALPGFQFAQQWGQNAVQNLGTTLGLGGNTLTAGAQYATGLAQQGFGQYANLLQNLLTSGTGALGTAGSLGTGVLGAGATTLSGASGALASGTQSALSSIGNAQAAGTLGTANAISSGLGGVGNAALLYGLSNKLGGGGGSIYGGNVAGLANTPIPAEA